MIIAQEKAFLKAQAQLQAMCRFVERAATDGQRIDQAERELFSQLLSVGLTLLRAFVAAQGTAMPAWNSHSTTIGSAAYPVRPRGVICRSSASC